MEAICSNHVVDFIYLFIYSIVVGICLLHLLKGTHFIICFVTINSAIEHSF